MERKIEFEISRLVIENDCTFVDGRNCGSPIRIGDIFTSICDRVLKEDSGNFIAGEVVQENSIQITVQLIETYRIQFDELSTGMTARMRVHGAGVEKLKEARVLTGLCK
jgi:hypothetical protein